MSWADAKRLARRLVAQLPTWEAKQTPPSERLSVGKTDKSMHLAAYSSAQVPFSSQLSACCTIQRVCMELIWRHCRQHLRRYLELKLGHIDLIWESWSVWFHLFETCLFVNAILQWLYEEPAYWWTLGHRIRLSIELRSFSYIRIKSLDLCLVSIGPDK